MSKNFWKGDTNSTFKNLGSSNHTEDDREINDYYATPPIAVQELLKVEKFIGPIWEPACGGGHMSEELIKSGYEVKSTDLIDRNYGKGGVDFLFMNYEPWNGNIITNPPFIYATQFVNQSLSIIPEGKKVAMFLRVLFLESEDRRNLFKNFPPKTVYVFTKRVVCAKNGEFEKYKSGAMCYAWFVWQKGFKGDTILKWIN